MTGLVLAAQSLRHLLHWGQQEQQKGVAAVHFAAAAALLRLQKRDR